MAKKFCALQHAITQSIGCNMKMDELGDRIILEFRDFFQSSDLYLEIELMQLCMSFTRKSCGNKYLRYYLTVIHREISPMIARDIADHIECLLDDADIACEQVVSRDGSKLDIEFYSLFKTV
jgi:hypothetical protein